MTRYRKLSSISLNEVDRRWRWENIKIFKLISILKNFVLSTCEFISMDRQSCFWKPTEHQPTLVTWIWRMAMSSRFRIAMENPVGSVSERSTSSCGLRTDTLAPTRSTSGTRWRISSQALRTSPSQVSRTWGWAIWENVSNWKNLMEN